MGDIYQDLEEEEVWAVMREKKGSPRARRAQEPTSRAPRRLHNAAWAIPTSGAHADADGSGGCCDGGKASQQSAPVSIPDWSKIYGKKGSSEGRGYRSATATGLGDGHDDGEAGGALDVGDDDDDDGDGMLPPHEWIARKLARSQISSFSVCEGVGRTLKGRDLSRVRNAVLSRTGFLE